MEIKGKQVALIGASGGIGSVLSQKLAEEGANLILVAKDENKLKELVEKLGSNHIFFAVDLTDKIQVQKFIADLKLKFDSLDVLINAAGIGIYKPIEDISTAEWANSLAINVTAPFLVTQGLLPLLNNSASGVVISTGSGMGVIPQAGRSAYCASKFALRGLMLSLATEFAHTKIKIVLLTLGSTLTEFGPLTLEQKRQESLAGKAYFTPEWVADKIVEIIKSDTKEVEYVLYPSDYNLGTWP